MQTIDSIRRRTFVLWISYFVPILYICTVLAQYGYNYFNLFLKSLKNADGTPTWTAQQVNAIPIGGGAINVLFGKHPELYSLRVLPILGTDTCVVVWVWGIASDVFETRWTLVIVQGMPRQGGTIAGNRSLTLPLALIGLIPSITMSVWTRNPKGTPLAAAYASYFITYLSLGTAPLIMSWVSAAFARTCRRSVHRLSSSPARYV